jgi:hypothetical protein
MDSLVKRARTLGGHTLSHVSDAKLQRHLRQNPKDLSSAVAQAAKIIPFQSPHESKETSTRFFRLFAVFARASCFHGFDKEGNVVHFERMSFLQPNALKRMFSVADMVWYKHAESLFYMSDACRDRAESAGFTERTGPTTVRAVTDPVTNYVTLTARKEQDHIKSSGRITTVIDIADIGTGKDFLSSWSRGYTREVADLLETVAPDTGSKILVINASFVFMIVWKTIKPLLSSNIQSMIEIHKDAKVLSKFINSNQIPRHYGGSCTRCENCLSNGPDQTAKREWFNTFS